jgi:hypothetical protein
MLFRSNDNLWPGALSFLSNSKEVTLYSAYIKTEQIEALNILKNIKRIVVRWEIRDLHQGASDLNLYEYCVENNIALYRNTRIHLKCLRNEADEVFFGSANVSQRGIGGEIKNFNYELNGLFENTVFADTLYLDNIIAKSNYVSYDLFSEIREMLDSLEDFSNQEAEYAKFEIDPQKGNQDYFLISELPMFMDVQNIYSATIDLLSLDSIERKCLAHDIATYGLDPSLSSVDFYDKLRETFNRHPFVLALKEQVKKDRRKSLSYGVVVDWIKKNTTTVPTPISWELKEKQVVNILYNWICYFDQDYTVERPGYSEVLFYRKNEVL